MTIQFNNYVFQDILFIFNPIDFSSNPLETSMCLLLLLQPNFSLILIISYRKGVVKLNLFHLWIKTAIQPAFSLLPTKKIWI